MDESRDAVIDRSAARDLGYGDADIRRLTLKRDWRRLRRGVYLTTELPRAPEVLHRLAVANVARRMSGRSAISHQSAAVLHGIPLWKVPRRQVHVTQTGRATSRKAVTLYTHPAGSEFDIVRIDGLPVVGAARTVVDLARTLSFEEGVVAADGALHRRIVTPDEIQFELLAARGRTGAARAAAVVAFANGRSESVGESRSRVLMRRAGLPIPELQVMVRDSTGVAIGRCDFGYSAVRVAAEFDGMVKYGRLLRQGEESGDAVFREKQREDRLRDAGWIVTRWVWDELGNPAVIVSRVREALRRAGDWRR
jgi:hypothetical protein